MDILIIYNDENCKVGFLSALTIKYFHDNDNCILLTNNKLNNNNLDIINKCHKIYIINYCLSEKQLEIFYKKCSNLIVIDNHKSNIDILYNWRKKITFAFDVNYCTSILTWKYFTSAKIPSIYKIIDNEERMQWIIPKSKEIIRGLHASNFFVDDNNNNWRFKLFQSSFRELIDLYYRNGYDIIAQENEILHEHEMKSKNVLFKGIKVLIIEADLSPELINELGSRLAENSEGKIGAVYKRKPYSKDIIVSLRAKKPIDLTKLGIKGSPLCGTIYYNNIDEFCSEFKNL